MKISLSLALWLTFVIPVTQEMERERTGVGGQPKKKASKKISTNKLSMIAHICNPS
jgi:hypothetical protein